MESSRKMAALLNLTNLCIVYMTKLLIKLIDFVKMCGY